MSTNLVEHNTLFNIDKAFEYLNGAISKPKLKKLFSSGEIPCRKIGTYYVTTKNYLDAYIENYEAKLNARNDKLNALVEKFRVKQRKKLTA